MQIQTEQSISQRIIRNTLYNVLGRLWFGVVSICLTPYIISRLGIERFGIWSVAGIVTGYFGLLDFGIGMSFVREIAGHYARKDVQAINKVVSIGFFFYLPFACCVASLVWALVPAGIMFFKVSPGLYPEMLFVFRASAVIFAAASICGIFTDLQNGIQRMGAVNVTAVALSCASIAGTVLCLERGWGLRGLMINNAVMAAAGSIVSFLVSRSIFPQLRLRISLCDARMFRRMLSFGCQTYVSRIHGLLTFQLGQIIIACFHSMGGAGLYQVGSSLIMKVREFPLLLVSAVVPAASELHAVDDGRRLRMLYERGTKYLAFFGIPLIVFAFVHARLIMFAWMGRGFDTAALMVMILAPAHMINILTGAGMYLSWGVGRPDYSMKVIIVQVVLNVLLTLILVPRWGGAGAAIAVLVSLSSTSVWFMHILHRHLGIGSGVFMRRTFLAPLAVSCAVMALSAGINALTGLDRMVLSRWAAAGVVCAEGAVCFSLYAVFLTIGGYIDTYDREVAARYIRDAASRFLRKGRVRA